MDFGVFLGSEHCKRRFLLLVLFPIIFVFSTIALSIVADARRGFDNSRLDLIRITPFIDILLPVALFLLVIIAQKMTPDITRKACRFNRSLFSKLPSFSAAYS